MKKLRTINSELVTNQGFTLIELIVVIAIISILSALLMTNFVGIRERGRDAQRKADVRQIQSALELYRADEGSYPTSGLDLCGDGNSLTSTDGATVYMQEVPCDPLGAEYYNSGVYYYESSDGSTYEIVACLENASDSDQNATDSPGTGTGLTPDCTSGYYFYVTNP